MIPTLQTFLRNANAEQRYLYEERAGIIEFCGNVPRKVAEREALRQMFGAYANGCPILGEDAQRDDL
jgi:hypothetical protein